MEGEFMKFSGKIGFWLADEETKPGVYTPEMIEKSYVGDIKRNIRRFQSVENQQNGNLKLNNQISIISDLYMQKNWPSIKYVVWNNVKWEVTSVDINSYPRVILDLGGAYHGKNSTS